MSLIVVEIVLTTTLSSTTEQTRVRILYSPTFLAQVHSGNVSSVSTNGTSVQGNVRVAVRYPTSSATPASGFATEIPEFANNDALIALQRIASLGYAVAFRSIPGSTGGWCDR